MHREWQWRTRTFVITDISNDHGGRLFFVRISSDLDISLVKMKSAGMEYPRGISVSKETGELLIGQFGEPMFDICNKEGDRQRMVTVAGARGASEPSCVTSTKEGFATLCISYLLGNDSIQWLNQRGKCTHTYGKKDGEHIGHGGFTVQDSEERLIVVDNGNNRLHLVDSSGHLLQFLLTEDDGITDPERVYLDEASVRLYVSHGEMGSGEVRVYRWGPKSGDCPTTT